MTTLIRKPRVAFQGERGAFSEEAAMKLLGDEVELVPRKTFRDLFDSLEKHVADYVLAPVENTIAGVVQPSVDLMRSSSLAILDEVVIKIEQHLIGCPGASFEAIETVQSHPVALAQCTRFFETNPQLKSVIADDTAGSVAEIVRLNDTKRAAIAGQRAADIYGASIIRRSIQDQTENYTRFVLLSAIRTAGSTYPALVKEQAS
ncbi:MAG TPA: prephenate dehydratase domain-containing protein [Pyrinomonadaceae bacterium]|nr:prephenate dehydratase domain-containing protein [Pyrinomonadaceae bacterium]